MSLLDDINSLAGTANNVRTAIDGPAPAPKPPTPAVQAQATALPWIIGGLSAVGLIFVALFALRRG